MSRQVILTHLLLVSFREWQEKVSQMSKEMESKDE